MPVVKPCVLCILHNSEHTCRNVHAPDLQVCPMLMPRRFTSALTPFTVVTTCISTELLPARPAQSIRKRFENLVSKSEHNVLPTHARSTLARGPDASHTLIPCHASNK